MCYTEEFLFVSLLFTGISMSDSNFSSLLDPFERIGNYSNDAESNGHLQPIVTLSKYGQIQGSIAWTAWTNQVIFQFLGVPYAESPSGSRRFKAPVPIRPWNGIYNARNYGKKCPTLEDIKQLPKSQLKNTDVEDCLNMAIFSKNLNASNPVMVYIHGGGFTSHSAVQFPPNYLMERDIVLVVIQFRLGVLGLMDSVQALKFIKENIQHFGGDASQITIFGQSSGSIMVSALVISPAIPEDLFQRAIVQSGSMFAYWAYSIDPVRDARTIAAAAGLNPNQSIAAMNRAFMSMSVLDLLEATSSSELKIALSGKLPTAGRTLSIGGPNKLLPDLPETILQSANFKKSVALMIGVTQTDGSYPTTMAYDFLDVTNRLDDKDFMANNLINALYQFLDIHDDTGTLTSLTSLTFWPNQELSSGNFGMCAPGIIDMLGMTTFKAPVLKLAQMNARLNPNRTFLYTFDYKGEHTRFGNGADVSPYPFNGGVTHSDDLIYLFPYPSNVAKLNEQDTKMAQKMVDLWTSFAINGTPKLPKMLNALDPTQWQPFKGLNGPYLHINTEPQIDDDFRREFTVTSRKYFADQKTN